MNAHRRKEAKLLRRRERVRTGRRPQRVDTGALAGLGAEKIEAAAATAPKDFGKAGPREPSEFAFEIVPCPCPGGIHGSHVRRRRAAEVVDLPTATEADAEAA